uniref:C2H2-type domain-containing protein n=1 Tax=Loa loa TaxID=7209 RepID=A0A1I7VRL5_LOALO
MFRCVVCPLQAPTYETVEELEIHIASDHISHVPYECERCRFSKFPTEFALISHCTTDHGLKEFYVKYKVTPDFHRKREKIREMLHHSVTVSKIPFGTYKRRKIADYSSLLSSGELCTVSVDSDELTRMTETEKEAKIESAKGSEVEPEDSTLEKESDSQSNTFPGAGLQQDPDQVNIVSILGDLYRNEGGSSATVAVTGCEPTDIVDPSNSLAANCDMLSQQMKKRSRPPRICNICGLQVTGQRSSLIYHANSKHVRLPMFFCRECKKTWTTITKSDVIKHVKACHDGDESLIEDHRMQYANDLHHITDKCFPRKSRGNCADDEMESLINPELWVKSEERGSFVSI